MNRHIRGDEVTPVSVASVTDPAAEPSGQERLRDAPVRLAAVVVTYNRLDHMKRTLARLLDEPCDRIFIVDNGSADGTRQWLEDLDDPRVHPILAPGNLGGAGGFELGLRKAMEIDAPDWFVIMDDDARPAPGCFAAFRQQDLSRWDAISSAVFHTDGRICEINRPTINPFWDMPTFARTLTGAMTGKARKSFHVDDVAYQSPPMEVDATSFVGFFLSRRAVERVGFPDGSLFIYGDDVLYTLTLRKAGMRIGFLPELCFEHDFNQAFNGKLERYNPIWKAYYSVRNGLLVYRFAAGFFFWPVILMIMLKWLLAGRHYGAARRSYYRMTWLGIRDGILGRRNRTHNEVLSLARG